MAKAKVRRQKPAPQRTCIVCRQTNAKRQLVRVVRTPENGVQIDPTGKLAGRGAYLCRNRACWTRALSHARLNAALKTTLTSDELAALHAFAAGLPELGEDALLEHAETDQTAPASTAVSPT